MSDFTSEVKAVTQQLDSIALSISQQSTKVPIPKSSMDEFSAEITAQSLKLKSALAAAAALKLAPVIESISPTSGPAGTPITITGTGFGDSPDGAIVHIAGLPAHPNSWSPTKIVATVPHGVTKGGVSVTTTGGKSSGSFEFTSDFVPPVPEKKVSAEPIGKLGTKPGKEK
jgi:IPT/TIG domain